MSESNKFKKEVEKLINFIIKKISPINPSSKIGMKRLRDATLIIVVELNTINLLLENKFPVLVVDKHTFRQYLNHVYRSFLNAIWIVVESRVRDIAGENDIDLKGRTQQARGHVLDALELAQNKEVKEELKKALDQLTGRFVEFDRVMDKVFIFKNLKKEDIDKWNGFLKILREMRNASHNNFICEETKILKSDYLEKEFRKGKSLQMGCEDIEKIIKGLYDFFKEID